MPKALVLSLAVSAAIIAGLTYLTMRPAQVNLAGESVSDQGREHIQIGQQHPPYNSNPPASGWHYPEPASWGFYDRELADEQVVHNLEHGGVWIAYQPNLDQATKDEIKRIVDRFPSKVIATARSKNDRAVTIVSWGRILKLETFSKDQMLDFIKRNRNHGPENVPD